MSVAKKMREKFPTIQHEYDVWHLAKSITKKLTELAKKHKELADWIPAIRNHLWFAANTCKGDEKLLITKWASMINHVQGIHSWKEGKQNYSCEHDTMNEEVQNDTKWVESRAAVAALKQATQNTRLVNQLKHCKNFVHTSSLESFHNVCLIYAPKRMAFSYHGMVLRTILAAMDTNNNVGREIVGTGMRYSKGQKAYVLLNKYEDKSDKWRKNLVNRIVQYVANPSLIDEDEAEIMQLLFPLDVPDNIAQVEKPPKETLEAKRMERLKAAEKQQSDHN
ncbi:Hypothetical predicted protein [Cloeon dipterum]|uniref:Uncharacterized protein n=1 Tax=Cloeon dipterum TaxID=197152 RepID=A0A8S1DRS2_9INSE|nr:Hypothetical predicted protein [Cloeon dipterum]